jgi:hypothetical protein
METSAVAIGGSHDRRVIRGPRYGEDGTHFRVAPPTGQWPTIEELVHRTGRIHTMTELYRIEHLSYATNDGRVLAWEFWVHESLTRDEAYIKLMEGYAR